MTLTHELANSTGSGAVAEDLRAGTGQQASDGLVGMVTAELEWPPLDAPTEFAQRQAHRRARRLKVLCVAADAGGLVLAALLAYGSAELMGAAHPGTAALRLAMLSIPLRLALFAQQGLYQTRHVAHHIEEFRRLVRAIALGGILLAGAEYVTKTVLPRGFLLVLLTYSFVAVVLERELVRTFLRRARHRGRRLRPVLLIGTGHDAIDAVRAIADEPWSGTRVVGYVGVDECPSLEMYGIHRLGGIDEAPAVAACTELTGVIIDTSSIEPGVVNEFARKFSEHAYYVELTSSLRGFAPERLDVVPLGRFTTVRIQRPARRLLSNCRVRVLAFWVRIEKNGGCAGLIGSEP